MDYSRNGPIPREPWKDAEERPLTLLNSWSLVDYTRRWIMLGRALYVFSLHFMRMCNFWLSLDPTVRLLFATPYLVDRSIQASDWPKNKDTRFVISYKSNSEFNWRCQTWKVESIINTYTLTTAASTDRRQPHKLHVLDVSDSSPNYNWSNQGKPAVHSQDTAIAACDIEWSFRE